MKVLACFFTTIMVASSLSTAALAASAEQSVSKVGRRSVHFSEVKNDNGQMIQRTVSDGFNTEIIVDINGDGAIDQWEITEGDVKIEGRSAYRGDFTTLFVTSREKDGERELIYDLSKDRKEYRLIYSKLEPYRIEHRSIGEPAPPSPVQRFAPRDPSRSRALSLGTCQATPQSVQLLNQQFKGVLSEAIVKSDSFEAKKALFEAMGSEENPLIDPSCGKDEFNQSKTDIVAGVSDVVGSTAASPGSKNKKYVACLDDLGLIMYSGKIRSRLSNLSPATRENKYLISCGVKKDNSTLLGGWNQLTQQVELYFPSSALGSNPSGEFAMTVFEELLHSAGLRDEKLARDVVTCCSDPEKNQSSCKTADAFVKREYSHLAYDGVFTKYSTEYENLRSQVMMDLGPNLGSVFLSNYMSGLSDRKLLTKEWLQNNCSGLDEHRCTQKFLTEVQKYNDGFFGSQCQTLFSAAADRTENRCSQYQADANKMIVQSLNLTTQCMEEAVPKNDGPRDARLERKESVDTEAALYAMMGLMRLMGVSPSSIARAADRCDTAKVWLANFTEEYENTAAPPVPGRKPSSPQTAGSTPGGSDRGGFAPGGTLRDDPVAAGSGNVTTVNPRIRTVTQGRQPVETNDNGQIPVSEIQRSLPIDPSNPRATAETLIESPRSAFVAPIRRALAEATDFVPTARAQTLSSDRPASRVRRRRPARSEALINERFTNPVASKAADEPTLLSVSGLRSEPSRQANRVDPSEAARRIEVASGERASVTNPARSGRRSARRGDSPSDSENPVDTAVANGRSHGGGGGDGAGAGINGSSNLGHGGGHAGAASRSGRTNADRLPSSDPRTRKKSRQTLPLLKTARQLHDFLTSDYEEVEDHFEDGKVEPALEDALEKFSVQVVPREGKAITPPAVKTTYRYNPATKRLEED